MIADAELLRLRHIFRPGDNMDVTVIVDAIGVVWYVNKGRRAILVNTPTSYIRFKDWLLELPRVD